MGIFWKSSGNSLPRYKNHTIAENIVIFVFIHIISFKQVPRFYNLVTTLLLPLEQKMKWMGMKTLGELKREKGIRYEPNVDSLYRVCTHNNYTQAILAKYFIYYNNSIIFEGVL